MYSPSPQTTTNRPFGLWLIVWGLISQETMSLKSSGSRSPSLISASVPSVLILAWNWEEKYRWKKGQEGKAGERRRERRGKEKRKTGQWEEGKGNNGEREEEREQERTEERKVRRRREREKDETKFGGRREKREWEGNEMKGTIHQIQRTCCISECLAHTIFPLESIDIAGSSRPNLIKTLPSSKPRATLFEPLWTAMHQPRSRP